jgi:D-3-phosphoglycerate dehydrogenase
MVTASWPLNETLREEGWPQAGPLRASISRDVCIVGGSYTGLWTAILLKQAHPELQIALIEQELCGYGASGCNGGCVLTLATKFLSLEKFYGTAEAVRLVRESENAVSEIDAFCKQHRIDCELQLDGAYYIATNRSQIGVLDPVLEQLDRQQILCHEVADAELLLMCYTPITKEVIAATQQLKGIVKYGVGIDTIDIPAAHARGIAVVNIPEYAEETVAEGAFALLIALVKRLPQLQAQMQSDGWAWPTADWLANDIAGKTLGIVGCGKIGSSMARMAGAGFRVRVLGYDPCKSREQLAAAGIEKCAALQAMLAECDFVSLHAVLNGETRHLIGAEEFAAMKPHAIFINTARGALVDEQALLEALWLKKIAAAGLDVFSREPLDQLNHPLRQLYHLKNVLLSPHLTFYTAEAMQRLEKETLERCAEIIKDRPVTILSKDPRLQLKE